MHFKMAEERPVSLPQEKRTSQLVERDFDRLQMLSMQLEIINTEEGQRPTDNSSLTQMQMEQRAHLYLQRKGERQQARSKKEDKEKGGSISSIKQSFLDFLR